MKALIFLLLTGLLVSAGLEKHEISYRIRNTTADTLVADVWINGSCFDKVFKILPPGTTTEIYRDHSNSKGARTYFSESCYNRMHALSVWRQPAYVNRIRRDSLATELQIDTAAWLHNIPESDWKFHQRAGNRGVALLTIAEEDFQKRK